MTLLELRTFIAPFILFAHLPLIAEEVELVQRESFYAVNLGLSIPHLQDDYVNTVLSELPECAVTQRVGKLEIHCYPGLDYFEAAKHMAGLKLRFPHVRINMLSAKQLTTGFSGKQFPQLCSPGSSIVHKQDNCTDASGVTMFPVQILTAESGSNEIASLLEKTDQVRSGFLSQLDDTKPFKGIYVSMDVHRNLDSNGSQEGIALELELFDEGWYESKRELDKRKLESRLQFFNMLKDMQVHELNEHLFRLQGVRNQLRFIYAQKRSDFLSKLLKHYQQRKEQGYATVDELETMRFQQAKAEAQSVIYRQSMQLGVSHRRYDLLNVIEHIKLQPVPELARRAITNSYDIQVKELQIDRSEFYPRWLDDLSVRLFLENRDTLFDDQRDNYIGVRVRVPIDWQKNRNDLVELEQDAYRNQRAAVKIRIAQRIDRLSELFHLSQQKIGLANREYSVLIGRKYLEQQKAQYPLAPLDAVPEKAIEQLNLQLLDQQEKLLLEKLAALEKMLELSALLLTDEPSSLFSY